MRTLNGWNVAGSPATIPRLSQRTNTNRRYDMTLSNRIRSFAGGVRYKARESRGKAKQAAGRATGNDRLRRRGRAEQLESRLHQFVNRIKDAIRR
jgi:uncharacterized protein YjbJ (UPF0337 family)